MAQSHMVDGFDILSSTSGSVQVSQEPPLCTLGRSVIAVLSVGFNSIILVGSQVNMSRANANLNSLTFSWYAAGDTFLLGLPAVVPPPADMQLPNSIIAVHARWMQ